MNVSGVLFTSFVILCWSNSRVDANNCTYSITTSRVIKAGRSHQFSVSISCRDQRNILLKAWVASKSLNSSEKLFKLKTGITKICSIAIPKSLKSSEEHFFCVEGSEGLSFYENRSVIVSRKLTSLFIQTDKAIYKPGDKVLYRVLVLNPDLKSSKSAVNITIFDPKGNRIYQSLNLRAENGVTSGYLPLSKSTILGKWTITVKAKDESKNRKFEVKEYILPKFKVDLVVPKRYLVNTNNLVKQENLFITMSARYTYGQPVKGTVLISICHGGYYQTRSNRPSITKTIMLEDGKASLNVSSLDLINLIPCFYGQPSLEYQSFNIEANVTEVSTGIVISERKNTVARPGRYQLETVTRESYFKPGFPLKIMFLLKHYTNESPLLDDVQYEDGSMRPIPVIVNMGFGGVSATTLEQRYLTNLTQNGTSHLILDTNANIKSLRIEAAFYDEYTNQTIRSYSYISAFETRDMDQLQISFGPSDKAVQAEKATTFVIQSSKPITTFQYQIFAKDTLFVSQEITGSNATIHSFVFNASKDLISNLMPEALIVATCVNERGEVIADSISVPVVNFFFNEIQMSFDRNMSYPSEEINLIMKAGKESTIALLAVDQSVRLLKGGNDISKEQVLEDLKNYGTPRYSIDGQDTKTLLENTGVIIMTNNYIHQISYDNNHDFDDPLDIAEVESESDQVHSMEKRKLSFRKGRTEFLKSEASNVAAGGLGGDLSKPRTEFPETWIWSDISNMDNESIQLTFKMPDTMTSWHLSAFAVNKNEGLGIASPVEVTVFKQMFVSLNLPYSVVRGEEFALAVTVFNYLDLSLDVNISLMHSEHFKIRKCDSTSLLETFEGEVSKTIKVKNKDSEGVYFWIVPSKVGHIPIEVKAVAGTVIDIIRMNLLVKPEGLPQSYSNSVLLGSLTHSKSHVDFHATLPPENILVPGSAIIEISVIGNIFASTIENIQNLVNLPAACGEQNMITFAPNVYILNFLSATNELNPKMKKSLTDRLIAGFAQQLTFQRNDGSYSAFGDKDKEGSVWLSAFVVKSFRHSKPYLSLDSKTVAKTLKWILSHQNSDGCFVEPPDSKIIHSKMQGGSTQGVTLTAYVLISLQENKIYKNVVKELDKSVKNATLYLEHRYASFRDDPYTLSIITYSFYLVKSRHFSNAFAMLEQLANKTGDVIYWQTQAATAAQNDAWRPFYEKPLTYDIETTSYALLIYTSQGNPESLLIAKWLIMQRNEVGGFRSTQDTIIGLEALSKFAGALTSEDIKYNLNVRVESNVNNWKQELINISKENSFLLQTVIVPENSTNVKVSVEGQGYAVAQLQVKYNVKTEIKHPLMELNVSSADAKDLLYLSISSRWIGKEASGMVIIEVEMPTGWEIENERDLSDALKNKVGEIENNGFKVIFYFNELTESPLNFEMKLVNKLSIFGTRPALVKMYRYYEPDATVSALYSTSGKQTWLTACPECCA